jgi:hypothetical protein
MVATLLRVTSPSMRSMRIVNIGWRVSQPISSASASNAATTNITLPAMFMRRTSPGSSAAMAG